MQIKLKKEGLTINTERLFYFISEKEYDKGKIKDIIKHWITLVDDANIIKIYKDIDKGDVAGGTMLSSDRFNIIEQYLSVKGILLNFKVDTNNKYIVFNKGMLKNAEIKDDFIKLDFHNGKNSFIIARKQDIIRGKDENYSVWVGEKIFKYLKETILKKDIIEI